MLGFYFLFAFGTIYLITSAARIPNLPHITLASSVDLARAGIKPRTLYLSTVTGSMYTAELLSSDFIGWEVVSSGQGITSFCLSSERSSTAQKWTTIQGSSGVVYGNCCDPLGSCEMATSCLGGTSIVRFDNIIQGCASTNACGTLSVFSSAGDPNPVTAVACWPFAQSVWALTRDIRAIATGSAISSILSTSSTPVSTATTTAASVVLSNPSATLSPQPPTSKAWIAGPVLGSVLGLLLLAGLGFFIYWRGQKSQQRLSQAPVHTPVDTPQATHYAQEMESPMHSLLPELAGQTEYVGRG